jgi:glutathione S-transferase
MLKQRESAAMQIDERVSPVPTLQQLRTLHPGALQHLQQSPDGQLYAHQHQALPQAVYHHAQQYALSGPPQPPPHALQYQHHGLPGSPVQFTAFPATYQHAPSPQFSIASGPVQQLTSPTHPPQQLPLPPPPPTRAAQQQLSAQAFQPQQLQHQSHGDALIGIPAPEPEDAPPSGHGTHFQGLKLIAEPPDLEAWRQKLFDVDDTITLNEDE